MKHLIVILTLAAFVTIPSFAEEKKCDKAKAECTEKNKAQCPIKAKAAKDVAKQAKDAPAPAK